jgi:hypothetical protein
MTPDEELKILRADWAALVAQVTGAESRRAGDLRRGETFTNSGGEVNDDITLPPWPEPRLEQHELELWGQNVCADLYDGNQMHAFARAAVLLDRQRRDKPSAGFLDALMEWSPPGTVRVFGDSQGNRFEIEVRKRRGVPAEGMGLEAIGKEPK